MLALLTPLQTSLFSYVLCDRPWFLVYIFWHIWVTKLLSPDVLNRHTGLSNDISCVWVVSFNFKEEGNHKNAHEKILFSFVSQADVWAQRHLMWISDCCSVFECEMKALDGNFFFSSVNGNIHSDLVFEKCSMLWSSEKVMAKFPYRN